jgi:predicted transcriptional regulator
MSKSEKQLEEAESKRIRILETLLLNGPQTTYDIRNKCKLEYTTTHDYVVDLHKENMIEIKEKERFKTGLEKKVYAIRPPGTLYLLLAHAKSITFQRELFSISKMQKSEESTYDTKKTIPELYPEDEIWDKLVNLIESQLRAWFYIPFDQLKFFKDSGELLRAFILLSMDVFAKQRNSWLARSIGLHDIGEIGLNGWSVLPYASDFILDLLSPSDYQFPPGIAILQHRDFRQVYRWMEYRYHETFFERFSNSLYRFGTDKGDVKLELLRKQAEAYLVFSSHMRNLTNDVLSGREESSRTLKKLREKLDSLEAKT